jgi:hypothetical protein
MKAARLLCFLIAGLFTALPGKAQRFRAGMIGGLVCTDVAGFDFLDYDNDFHKGGFTFGGYVNARIDEQNSWQFEISYVRKGTLQSDMDSLHNLTYFYLLQLNYIEVPLLYRHQFHIQVRSKETDRFSMVLGPSLGALVNVYQEGLFYQGGAYYSSYFNNSDFRRAELALHAGVSYNFFNNFYFDVRYSNSILPVTKRDLHFDQFFRYTWNKGDNMVFSFTLRYLFGTPQTSQDQG